MVDVRKLDPAFQCAACRRAATWMVDGTSSCDYHRAMFIAVSVGGRS